MSGNFTQRGDFAVYNKFERAQAAINNGADLVLEIPALCTIQSAQGYAKSGVKILEATGICDCLAFGAETDDIAQLKAVSQKIKDCDEQIINELAKDYMIDFDDAGSIGKRYRRQDEIGTPFCITYDFDSEQDGCVTVRDRDTMEQTRLPIGELSAFIKSKLEF